MIINSYDLSQKLKLLKGVVPPKINGEALTAGVLIKDGYIQANNLELAIVCEIDTQGEAFVLPTNAMDLIEKLPPCEVEITEKNNKVTVKSEKGRSSFATTPIENFIETNVNAEIGGCDSTFTVDGDDLSKDINKVLYAVCADNAKHPAMCGIKFESEYGELNLIGCDGYRMAVNTIKYDGKDIKSIVPRRALQKVLQIGLKGDVELYTNEKSKLILKTDEYTLFTSALVGDYINYKSAFPQNPIAKVDIDRVAFFNTLNRLVIATSNDRVAPAVLSAEANTREIKISKRTPTTEFMETIAVENDIPKDIKIGINANYVMDALKAAESEYITMHYSGPVQPIVFYDEEFKQLVLPVRMKGE